MHSESHPKGAGRSASAPRPASRRRPPARPPDALIYGPVASRRLGRSLGINLTPAGCRVCNFDCVYCEVPRQPWGGSRQPVWPTPAALGAALASALRRCGPLDSITISGNGEPTLHPDFEAAVDAVLAAAHGVRPGVPVRILTNGTGAVRPEVRRALDRLDERIVTLDAAPERVDRPAADRPLGGVVVAASMLRDVSLQCCFVDGGVSNLDEADLKEWIELVGELCPARVRIYTIDRKPATRLRVWPASPAQLARIAARLRRRTGIRAQVVA